VRTISVTLDDRADQVLQDLESKTGLPVGALFSFSLSLGEWAFQQRVQDRQLATLDADSLSYRILDLAASCQELEVAAARERAKERKAA
jgi:hypothetical protein